jgi:cytochrome c oxidase subunit 3/cytochrome o ubiquinol oxidase subunit 3
MSSVPAAAMATTEMSHAWRGRAGMISLIVAEASLFAVFVVAYLFYIGKSLNGPYPEDVLGLPVVGTICLLSSSVSVALASRALGRGGVKRSGVWLLVTILLGAIFLAETMREWYGLIWTQGLTIGTNLFGTTFYPLVGLHASHVIVGLVMLGLCAVFAWTGALRPAHHERVEMVSWYWHFVDAVWIVVFTVVYVIGR